MNKLALKLLVLCVIVGGIISPFIAVQFTIAASMLYIVILFIALLFQPFSWASQTSVIFVSGVAVGLALALALAFLGMAIEYESDTLISISSVLFPLLSSSVFLYLFIKANRSNPSFKRDYLR